MTQLRFAILVIIVLCGSPTLAQTKADAFRIDSTFYTYEKLLASINKLGFKKVNAYNFNCPTFSQNHYDYNLIDDSGRLAKTAVLKKILSPKQVTFLLKLIKKRKTYT